MAAIITDVLKKQMMQKVFDEATTSTEANYYVGIGKSSQWDSSETVPTPIDTPKTIRDARSAIQSMKKVEGTSFVIPRHNWSSGTTYSAYDDNLTGIPSNTYYVITDENQVYICLQQSRDATGAAVASTVKPTVTDVVKPFKTADGYKWKFLYTLSAAKASKFLSSNFVPVEKVLADSALQSGAAGSNPGSLTASEIEQKQVDSNATPGQIVGVVITNGGTGYSTGSPPAVTILGDGDSATAAAVVSGGSVVKIELDSSADSCMNMGHGYNFASVSIAAPTSGTTATARAVIGPDSGMGADPRDELKSTSLMFNIKPDGEVAAGTVAHNVRKTFLVDQNFRQVALIRNPKYAQNNINPDDDSGAPPLFTDASGLALQYLQVDDSSDITGGKFAVGSVITGGTSGAKAIIDANDTTTGFNPKLIVHQDSATTGFGRFQGGEQITDGANNADLVDSANGFGFRVSDVEKTSGEIIYIDNRAPVDRTSTTQEDIKVVITL